MVNGVHQVIRNSKQSWEVGESVKVGFLTLIVVASSHPGDFLPDAYVLTNKGATKFYRFVPHHGLTSHPSKDAAIRGEV
ncbi:hypothetical protein SNK04_014131 [Fusarium graminearum]